MVSSLKKVHSSVSLPEGNYELFHSDLPRPSNQARLTTARCASTLTHKAALCGSALADTNLGWRSWWIFLDFFGTNVNLVKFFIKTMFSKIVYSAYIQNSQTWSAILDGCCPDYKRRTSCCWLADHLPDSVHLSANISMFKICQAQMLRCNVHFPLIKSVQFKFETMYF